MKRYGMAIRLKSEYVNEYLEMHENPSEELLKALEKVNIQNNTVFFSEGVLFNYFEYSGRDFKKDWQVYIETPVIKDLFKKMKGFFEPLGDSFPKTGWAVMEEVFRKD